MWRIGLAFLIGHCLVHGLTQLPPVQSGSACIAVLLVLSLCLRVRWLSALLLGIAWAWFNAHARLSGDLPEALEGQDLLVRGYVSSMPDKTDTDPQFEFDVVDQTDGLPPRLRLAWYESELWPAPGELWQFVVRLKRRNGFANPGGFDYEGHLFRTGVGATGYVRADERNLRLSAASWRYGVLRLRAWLANCIALAARDHSQLGVLQGLAVGETQAMTAEQWRVFAATGTTHLMAISGLHISMVAMVLAWWGGGIVWLRSAQRHRFTAVQGKALIGALAAVSYSCLAGLSVPTQRTLVMLCIFFAARWWRRELSVSNALGLALICILLLDPFAPLAVGAWLSFVAVAVILLAVGGRLAEEQWLRGFTHVQLAVTAGMAPLVIGAFSSLSLVSPLANAIAVPLFTIALVPLVLIGTLLATVSASAGGALLGLATAILNGCWPAIQWMAAHALAVWHFPSLPVVTFAALVVGGLLLVVPAIWPVRIVAVMLCLPAVVYRPAVPAPGSFELTTLDVGQGLAVVVRTHAHVLVYDTGPAFRTGRDTGELVVLPFLHSVGVRRVDALMVSHGDLDHSGGLYSLLKGLPVTSVVVGPSMSVRSIDSKAERVNTRHCARGQHWVWDGVDFEVLHPDSDRYDSDNDSSCVLRISGQGGSALLTGDIEHMAEAAVVAHGLTQSDLVVVAHHGSRSSSTAELVEAAQAKLAIMSAGYRNRWGFPKPEVSARWQQSGASVWSTIDSGAVVVMVDEQGVRPVREYRKLHRHYWSAR